MRLQAPTPPGALTFPIVRRLVEGILLVSEEEIRAAMRFLLERMKILAEPSGAVAAAAVIFGRAIAGGDGAGWGGDFGRECGFGGVGVKT